MSPSSIPKIAVICGPTGVGKTTFAIELARHFSGEIIGADSMQIYRQMNVGTAKPTLFERAAVRHRMVDIIEPDEPYDAASYSQQAHHEVQSLLADNIRPFVVGGTGLYIKALIYGLFKSRGSDQTLRRQLRGQMDSEGSMALHQRLSRIDAAAAARIHPNDAYRILRALEVIQSTGRPISDHHENHGFLQSRYQHLTIGLVLPREELYTQIDRRVDRMIADGLCEEVRGLLERGYSPQLKSMQALGYRHMVAYLDGHLSWDEAVYTLKRDHRRYAKRQLTWFRAIDHIHWLSPGQLSDAQKILNDFLSD